MYLTAQISSRWRRRGLVSPSELSDDGVHFMLNASDL
jgi:hypothetical protein